MSNWDISNAGKLVFLIVLIAGSIGAGYAARRGGLTDSLARKLMYFVITVPYASVGFLAIWGLKFSPQFAVLPLFGFTIMAAGVGVGIAAARWLRLDRPAAGAFVLAAGASNLGFTMGGFVNYVLFGQQGLAVAAMFTLFWDFGMVLVLYPVARHYGHRPGLPMWRLVAANFGDIRSLPFYCTVVGLTLNRLGVPRPDLVGQALLGRLTIVDVLMLVGAVVAFFTTGLRLHFAQLGLRKRLHPLVAGVKFLVMPAVGALLVAAMAWAGHGLPFPADRVVMVQACAPVAIYAVVISSLFSLDDRLAGVLFVVNTAVYLAAVMPIVVMLLGRPG